jgi:drug/metabolite transporter (DMT)-like permease
MSHLQANLVLLLCAAIWAFAFLFQKAAMEHVEPMLFVAARSAIAAVVLLPFVLIEQRTAAAPLPPRFGWLVVLAGVTLAVAGIMQQTGIVTASVTNTAFLTSLYVVATPLAAWLLLAQRPRGWIWLSVAMSLLGAWLLGGGGLTNFSGGDALIVASTVIWALHALVLGFAARHARPVLLTALQFVIAAAIGMAGALAFETISFAALRRAAVDILYVGVFSSALTFTLFAAAMRHTSPSEAMIVVSTEAPLAALAAWVLRGESPTTIAACGAALILAAAINVHLLGAAMQQSARHGAAGH